MLNCYSEKDAFIRYVDEYKARIGRQTAVQCHLEFRILQCNRTSDRKRTVLRCPSRRPEQQWDDAGVETPKSDCQDIAVTIEITRSASRTVRTTATNGRYMDSGRRFDFLKLRSGRTCLTTFRAARVRLATASTCVCCRISLLMHFLRRRLHGNTADDEARSQRSESGNIP